MPRSRCPNASGSAVRRPARGLARDPNAEVAARFQCSWSTVKRWADRYAAGESMADYSSRPRPRPGKTDRTTARRIISLRLRKRLGPLQLGRVSHIWGEARGNLGW